MASVHLNQEAGGCRDRGAGAEAGRDFCLQLARSQSPACRGQPASGCAARPTPLLCLSSTTAGCLGWLVIPPCTPFSSLALTMAGRRGRLTIPPCSAFSSLTSVSCPGGVAGRGGRRRHHLGDGAVRRAAAQVARAAGEGRAPHRHLRRLWPRRGEGGGGALRCDAGAGRACSC